MYVPPTDNVPERMSESTRLRWEEKNKNTKPLYIRGPIPLEWLRGAIAISRSATAVALAICFKVGVTRGSKTVSLTPGVVEKLGVSRRSSTRGLKSLEVAGLVSVERKRGKCPVVTVLEVETGER